MRWQADQKSVDMLALHCHFEYSHSHCPWGIDATQPDPGLALRGEILWGVPPLGVFPDPPQKLILRKIKSCKWQKWFPWNPCCNKKMNLGPYECVPAVVFVPTGFPTPSVPLLGAPNRLKMTAKTDLGWGKMGFCSSSPPHQCQTNETDLESLNKWR